MRLTAPSMFGTDRENRRRRRDRFWFGRVIVLMLVGQVAFSIFMGLAWLRHDHQPGPFDPLSFPKNGTFSDRLPGIAGPAARIGQGLHLTSVACNSASDPVKVIHQSFWEPIAPSGSAVDRPGGLSSFQPGCKTSSYLVEQSPALLAQMRRYAAAGYHTQVWQMTGIFKPLGDRVVAEGWESQQITVVVP